jgi:tRNA(Ile)-lysidine synthase
MITLCLKDLPAFREIKRFVIAYSGGLDSHVLLHSLAVMRAELGGRELLAVHVNHGLSANAQQWSAHCAKQCEPLGITLKQFDFDARAELGESPEAAARDGRYAILASMIEEGDCLLTAHHQDDQAETLLIQLLRGAGPRGLAAMPGFVSFAGGWHARPLLGYSRDELQDYAQQAQLSWIDDESNSDTRFDRNFLRHDILPRLKARFPGMNATLSRSATLCAEAAELLVGAAQADLSQVQLDVQSVSVSGLQTLGEVRARNLLHQWCRDRGLPTPSAAQLQCVWDGVIGAGPESEPVVRWPGGEARRYRDALFVGSPLSAHDVALRLPWDLQHGLSIPALGELRGERVMGQGISASALESGTIEIRFRQGGEQLRPAGRLGHHSLKKLFQEAGIPPWRRDRIPLIYDGEQLLAVAGLWVAHEAAAQADEPGVILNWSARN